MRTSPLLAAFAIATAIVFAPEAHGAPIEQTLSNPGSNLLNLYSSTSAFQGASGGVLPAGWFWYINPTGTFAQVYTRFNGPQPTFDFNVTFDNVLPTSIDFQTVDYNWTTNTINGGFRYNLLGPTFSSFGPYGAAGGPVPFEAPLAATPEPGTIAVIGLGVALAGLRRHRKKPEPEKAP